MQDLGSKEGLWRERLSKKSHKKSTTTMTRSSGRFTASPHDSGQSNGLSLSRLYVLSRALWENQKERESLASFVSSQSTPTRPTCCESK